MCPPVFATFVGPLRQPKKFVDDLGEAKVIESLCGSEGTITGADEPFLVAKWALVIGMGRPLTTVDFGVPVPVAWTSVILIGAKIIETTDAFDEMERRGQDVADGENNRV